MGSTVTLHVHHVDQEPTVGLRLNQLKSATKLDLVKPVRCPNTLQDAPSGECHSCWASAFALLVTSWPAAISTLTGWRCKVKSLPVLLMSNTSISEYSNSPPHPKQWDPCKYSDGVRRKRQKSSPGHKPPKAKAAPTNSSRSSLLWPDVSCAASVN